VTFRIDALRFHNTAVPYCRERTHSQIVCMAWTFVDLSELHQQKVKNTAVSSELLKDKYSLWMNYDEDVLQTADCRDGTSGTFLRRNCWTSYNKSTSSRSPGNAVSVWQLNSSLNSGVSLGNLLHECWLDWRHSCWLLLRANKWIRAEIFTR